jgi:hypothetical protein
MTDNAISAANVSVHGVTATPPPRKRLFFRQFCGLSCSIRSKNPARSSRLRRGSIRGNR